jgi:hypothetical protein
MITLGDGRYLPTFEQQFTGQSGAGLEMVSPYRESGLQYITGGNIPFSTAEQSGQTLGDTDTRFSRAPAGGASGSGTQFKDTTAQRQAAYAGLDSLGTVQANKLADEDVAYGNLTGQYDTEFAKEQGRMTDQTAKNERSLASNTQAGMLAAAQGGRGLRATLAAMGALGGTGGVLADRAIMDSANKDLGGARDNFETNAETLQTSWGDFEDQDKRRREAAMATRDANKRAVEGDVLAQRQKLLQDLAGFYEQAGNTGQYNTRMAEATSLTPQIAGRTAPRQALTRQDASFNPGELGSYLAGNRDMTVGRQAGAEAGTALNNPLYALSNKREEELV